MGMEKVRTIYRLRSLRGGLILALLTILWGIILNTVIRAFPGVVLSEIKKIISDNVTRAQITQDQLSVLSDKAMDMLRTAAFESLIAGMLLVVLVLILIRLNGNKKTKAIISWIFGIGVVLFSIGLFIRPMALLNTTSLETAINHSAWVVIPGLVLIFLGFIAALLKTLKDLF